MMNVTTRISSIARKSQIRSNSHPRLDMTQPGYAWCDDPDGDGRGEAMNYHCQFNLKHKRCDLAPARGEDDVQLRTTVALLERPGISVGFHPCLHAEHGPFLTSRQVRRLLRRIFRGSPGRR